MAPQVTTNGVTYTDFHADTPETIKNEKRALLALMAEHGTEGQIEYQRNKDATQQSRQASIEAAAARGAQIHAPGTLQTELTQDYDTILSGVRQTTDEGMLGHGREMDRIAAANAAYLDQVAGASQLNRDLLASQIGGAGGGGGGGGGGGRGGGGSGGGLGSAYVQPRMSLEQAGITGGLESYRTVDGEISARSAVSQLFGRDADDQPLLNSDGTPLGNPQAVAVLERMEAAASSGLGEEELAELMFSELMASGLSVWQKDAAATALSNYFGLSDEPVELGEFAELMAGEFEQGIDPSLSLYTREGRDLMEQQDRMLAMARGGRAVDPSVRASTDARVNDIDRMNRNSSRDDAMRAALARLQADARDVMATPSSPRVAMLRRESLARAAMAASMQMGQDLGSRPTARKTVSRVKRKRGSSGTKS